MTKPSKPQLPIQPRTAGLWQYRTTHAEQVELARTHLLLLLADPYYHEAYEQLRRGVKKKAGPKVATPHKGRLPPKGELAARYQGAVQPFGVPKKSSSRLPAPRRKVAPVLARIVSAMAKARGTTVAEAARFVLAELNEPTLKQWIPGVSAKAARRMAKQVASAARYESRTSSLRANSPPKPPLVKS